MAGFEVPVAKCPFCRAAEALSPRSNAGLGRSEQDGVVDETEHWNEVGYQVDGAQGVGDGEKGYGHGRHVDGGLRGYGRELARGRQWLAFDARHRWAEAGGCDARQDQPRAFPSPLRRRRQASLLPFAWRRAPQRRSSEF